MKDDFKILALPDEDFTGDVMIPETVLRRYLLEVERRHQRDLAALAFMLCGSYELQLQKRTAEIIFQANTAAGEPVLELGPAPVVN